MNKDKDKEEITLFLLADISAKLVQRLIEERLTEIEKRIAALEDIVHWIQKQP